MPRKFEMYLDEPYFDSTVLPKEGHVIASFVRVGMYTRKMDGHISPDETFYTYVSFLAEGEPDETDKRYYIFHSNDDEGSFRMTRIGHKRIIGEDEDVFEDGDEYVYRFDTYVTDYVTIGINGNDFYAIQKDGTPFEHGVPIER